jgi:hypothetical protein
MGSVSAIAFSPFDPSVALIWERIDAREIAKSLGLLPDAAGLIAPPAGQR